MAEAEVIEAAEVTIENVLGEAKAVVKDVDVVGVVVAAILNLRTTMAQLLELEKKRRRLVKTNTAQEMVII